MCIRDRGGVSGTITDRDNTVLAQSSNGERIYNEDPAVRCAMLQTVGDTRGYISTSVQYVYRAPLSGYNLVTGLYSPTGGGNGSKIQLTLDAELCKTAYNAMNGRKGSVLVYNYKTGEIICMVSSPTFDPVSYTHLLRFPADKEYVTGIRFEPWHYRYVGVEHAKEMNRLGMCLEEYIDYLNAQK